MFDPRLLLKASLALSFCLAFSVGHAANFGADRHVAKGIPCEACHGANMDKSSPEIPEEAACLKCHDKKALAAKTQNLPGANPHAAPHNGDCTLCHMQHEEPVNYCAQCHQFNFKVK